MLGVPAHAQPSPGRVVEPRVLFESGLAIGTFGRGADGELYLADISGGTIYRIAAAAAQGGSRKGDEH